MAGFRSPLFLLGLSSGQAQAGFRGALPLPPLGGSILPLQAGFIGPIPLLNLGAGEPLPPDPDVPTGGGGGGYDFGRIWREDEEILAVIIASSRTVH